MTMIKALAMIGALTGMAGSASAYVIYDGSFEFPSVPRSDVYRPIIAEGGFSGDAGVDGGAFSYFMPPDGHQDGFLQSVGSGAAEIDLAVHGLTIGDTYSFSYYDAQRSGYGLLPYTVSVDGTSIYSGTPSSFAFTKVTTSTFVATRHGPDPDLLRARPDDGRRRTRRSTRSWSTATAARRAYGVSTVPEPASWALMLVGFGAAGAAVRSRRKAIAV